MTTKERKKSQRDWKEDCRKKAIENQYFRLRVEELEVAEYWRREIHSKIFEIIARASSQGVTIKEIADQLPKRDPVVIGNIVRRGVRLGFYHSEMRGKGKYISVIAHAWAQQARINYQLKEAGKDHLLCLRCLANPVSFLAYNVINKHRAGICVSDIEKELGAIEPISPVLKRMREAGLVLSLVSGQKRIYQNFETWTFQEKK